jgi:hypothetical protein
LSVYGTFSVCGCGGDDSAGGDADTDTDTDTAADTDADTGDGTQIIADHTIVDRYDDIPPQ